MYTILYEKKALKQLMMLKYDKKTLQKVQTIIQELSINPYSPTHKFEKLKHNLTGLCSKRIDQKNRILYQVKDQEVIVIVISLLGHY